MEGYLAKGFSWEERSVLTGKLKIGVTNIPEFKELLSKADSEARQLSDTLNKLRCFELDIDFSTDGSTFSGA